MTKSKRRQGLSGTVLIMVLTVMVILIIMLMATLTVVTTAGQRIYTKYEENQAYYTARSALDVFTNNMLNDNSYYAYEGSVIKAYSYTDRTDSANPVIKDKSFTDPTAPAAKMKQGLALQGDLYKIESQGLTTAKVAAAYDSSSYKEATGEPNAAAYDALSFAENMLVSDDVFGKVGSTDCPENTFFSVSDTALNFELNKDYIEYQIVLPDMGKGSNQYGKFVDTGADDLDGDGKKDQIATIKVEVLDRVYDTKSGYSRNDILQILDGTNASVTPQDLKNEIRDGDRSKDKMRVRITATVQFMDTEGMAVLVYDTTSPTPVASDSAITSLNEVSSTGSGLKAVGGASSLCADPTKPLTINASGTAGVLYSEGGMFIDSSGTMILDANSKIVAKGDISFKNSQAIESVEDGAFIYAGGTFIGQTAVGTSTHPVSIIADTFRYTNSTTYVGNIYTNNFYYGYSTSLTINNENYNTGATDITVNGTVYAKDLYFDSNRATYDSPSNSCTIKVNGNTIKYSGDIYVDGTKVPASATINVTSGTVTKESFTMNIVYNDGTAYTMTSENKKKFTLPAALPGVGTSNTIDVDTTQSVYSDYFHATDFIEESSQTGYGGDLVGGYDQSNIFAKMISAEEEYSGSATGTLKKYTTYIDTSSGTISGSGILNAGSYGSVTVDATSSNIEIQLEPGTTSGTFTVIGDKQVIILIPEQATPTTFSLGDTGHDFVFLTSNLATATSLNLGNCSNPTKAPNVTVYAGKNTNIDIYRGSVISGYVHAQNSKVQILGNHKQYSTTYSGSSATDMNFGIIGSLVCQNYYSKENVGVAYINPDSASVPAGEPHLSWVQYQYTRN